MTISENTKGIIFTLASCAVFAVSDTIVKYMGQTYSVYQIAFFSKLFAALILGGYMIIKRQKLVTYFPQLQLYRSISLTLNALFLYYAFKYMTLTDIALLFYLCPFVVAILSLILLKEPIGLHRLLSIIGGFIGVLIMVRPGFIEVNHATPMALMAVIFFSYANVLSRKIGKTEPSINFTLFPTLMTTICMIPLLMMTQQAMPEPVDLALMAFGGTAGSVAILLISMAFVRTHAVTVSLLDYTHIFWALLFGYLVFGDVTNDPYTIIGGCVIIISGAYLIYRESKANKNNSKAY